MEHGAQTHALPVARERLRLVARRCDYLTSEDAAAEFLRDLEAHTAAVRVIYQRVFADSSAPFGAKTTEAPPAREMDDETARLVRQAVAALVRVATAAIQDTDANTIEGAIVAALISSERG